MRSGIDHDVHMISFLSGLYSLRQSHTAPDPSCILRVWDQLIYFDNLREDGNLRQKQQEQPSATYLIIREGAQAGKRIEIYKECTTIGRSRECDIFLEDVAVHRKQASILLEGSEYTLRDDHGSGDSFVNGRSVTEQLLKDGDELLIGNTHITFCSQEAATRPIPLALSRGRELSTSKTSDSAGGSIASLELIGGMASHFELEPEMTIVRSRDCDIFLEDLAVSRVHVTIHQLPGGGYELE